MKKLFKKLKENPSILVIGFFISWLLAFVEYNYRGEVFDIFNISFLIIGALPLVWAAFNFVKAIIFWISSLFNKK